MSIWVRGAITVKENCKEEILANTKILLKKILEVNQIEEQQVQSILFTATKDLDQIYPAVAAREIGLTEAALLCFQEMSVEKSLPLCIRVAVVAETEKKQKDAIPVYLEKAVQLRPDLQEK